MCMHIDSFSRLDLQNYAVKSKPWTKTPLLSIPDVDFESFILFLKFLYTGDIGCDLEKGLSFLPLLKIATDYQVTTLSDSCAKMAKRSLSEENVLSIFQLAMECNHRPTLINSSLIFICRQAWKIVETQGFNELRQECLYEILKRDDLQVKSELHLFQAVLRWAEAECIRSGREPGDWDNIRSALSKVIGLIRFPVMNQGEFAMHVALKKLLSLEELVKILLYFTVPPAEREQIPPGTFISTPRQYYKEELKLPAPPDPAVSKTTTNDDDDESDPDHEFWFGIKDIRIKQTPSSYANAVEGVKITEKEPKSRARKKNKDKRH